MQRKTNFTAGGRGVASSNLVTPTIKNQGVKTKILTLIFYLLRRIPAVYSFQDWYILIFA
jgi:hypothetical protein